jgi:hypothetical protein
LDFGRLDVETEGVWFDNGRREVNNAAADQTETLRTGSLTGYSYYVSAAWSVLGPTAALRAFRWEPLSLIMGGGPPKEEARPKPTLQILTRWEQVFFNYNSVARSPEGVERGLLDEHTTRGRADILQLGLSLWLSVHLKLLAQWDLYYFPGSTIDKFGNVDNLALAPGAVRPGDRGTRRPVELPVDVTNASDDPSFFRAPAPDARTVHELGFRIQFVF